jgi:hypothetical protein
MDDIPGPLVSRKSRPNGSRLRERTPSPSFVALPANPHSTLVRVMVLSGDCGRRAELWLASTPQELAKQGYVLL